MSRTIKEIANGIKADFISNQNLCNAFNLTYDANRSIADCITYYDNHFSAVSVETCLIYLVATCVVVLENMFEWFKDDVNEIITNERYGHKGWYEQTAKKYEDFGNNIISHASCEEMNFGVKLKVAKMGDNGLEKLDNDELTRFSTWMNRKKVAGIPIVYINEDPDDIKLSLVVYYDVLKFADETICRNKVIESINGYLNDIEFNGYFTTMNLVDAMQRVEGLDIIEITSVQTKYAGYNYTNIENSTRYNPYSGYLRLDENNSNIMLITNN